MFCNKKHQDKTYFYKKRLCLTTKTKRTHISHSGFDKLVQAEGKIRVSERRLSLLNALRT